MKKLLSVVVVLAMMLSLGAVTVSAAEDDANKVIAELSDMHELTAPETWDDGIEHEFDGNKLKITNNVGGNYGDFTVKSVKPGTYKVAFFYEILAVKDSANPPSDIGGMQDWRTIIKVNDTQMNLPYYPCTFDNINFTGLSTVVGKKIIAISVIEVTEEKDLVINGHVRMNGDDEHKNILDATLDKIVLAGADYDFGPANYPDYEIFIEQAPHEGDAAKKGQDGDWTASILKVADDNKDETNKTETNKTETNKTETNKNETNKNETNKTETNKNETNKDENKGNTNNVPQTSDVSVMLAVVAAGAAAFGGLKLRKK